MKLKNLLVSILLVLLISFSSFAQENFRDIGDGFRQSTVQSETRTYEFVLFPDEYLSDSEAYMRGVNIASKKVYNVSPKFVIHNHEKYGVVLVGDDISFTIIGLLLIDQQNDEIAGVVFSKITGENNQ
jgi:hypothetical protein